MVLIFIPIAWLAVMTVVAAVCCTAARGDQTEISGVELPQLELGVRPGSAVPDVSRLPSEAPSALIAA